METPRTQNWQAAIKIFDETKNEYHTYKTDHEVEFAHVRVEGYLVLRCRRSYRLFEEEEGWGLQGRYVEETRLVRHDLKGTGGQYANLGRRFHTVAYQKDYDAVVKEGLKIVAGLGKQGSEARLFSEVGRNVGYGEVYGEERQAFDRLIVDER